MCNFAAANAPGDRRVRVAVNNHRIRLHLFQHLLDANQHGGGLLAMRTGTDAEVFIGRGNVQFLEKHIRHICVVVLARMNQILLMLLPKFRAKRRRFNELRPSADDGNESHEI